MVITDANFSAVLTKNAKQTEWTPRVKEKYFFEQAKVDEFVNTYNDTPSVADEVSNFNYTNV